MLSNTQIENLFPNNGSRYNKDILYKSQRRISEILDEPNDKLKYRHFQNILSHYKKFYHQEDIKVILIETLKSIDGLRTFKVIFYELVKLDSDENGLLDMTLGYRILTDIIVNCYSKEKIDICLSHVENIVKMIEMNDFYFIFKTFEKRNSSSLEIVKKYYPYTNLLSISLLIKLNQIVKEIKEESQDKKNPLSFHFYISLKSSSSWNKLLTSQEKKTYKSAFFSYDKIKIEIN